MNALRISVSMDGQRGFRPANLEKASIMRGERIRNAVCISSPSGTWHTNYKISFYLHGCLENKIKKLCFGYNDCTVLFPPVSNGKRGPGPAPGCLEKKGIQYQLNSSSTTSHIESCHCLCAGPDIDYRLKANLSSELKVQSFSVSFVFLIKSQFLKACPRTPFS